MIKSLINPMIKSLILLNLTILSLSTTFAHLLFSGFPPYYFRHRVEIQGMYRDASSNKSKKLLYGESV